MTRLVQTAGLVIAATACRSGTCEVANAQADCLTREGIDGTREVFFLPSTPNAEDASGLKSCDAEVRSRVMDGLPPCDEQ